MLITMDSVNKSTCDIKNRVHMFFWVQWCIQVFLAEIICLQSLPRLLNKLNCQCNAWTTEFKQKINPVNIVSPVFFKFNFNFKVFRTNPHLILDARVELIDHSSWDMRRRDEPRTVLAKLFCRDHKTFIPKKRKVSMKSDKFALFSVAPLQCMHAGAVTLSQSCMRVALMSWEHFSFRICMRPRTLAHFQRIF